MATVAARKTAAIVGAAVADAAIQPIHWVYNAEKLDSLLDGKEEIEFFDPPANPFYRIQTGLNSCYGDQAFVLLESLVHCQGLDTKDLAERSYKMFGPGSVYENPEIDNYVPKSGGYLIGMKVNYPISTPWKHMSIKHFLANYSAGKEVTGSDDDLQMDGVARLAPIVAMYAGKPEMLKRVEQSCRAMQNSDFTVTCVLAAARLLEHYILHGPDPAALDKVIDELSDHQRENPQELDRGLVGMLRQVRDAQGQPHRQVVTEMFRKD